MPSILSRLLGGAGALARAQKPERESLQEKASRTGALFAMQQLGVGRFTPRPNTELTRQGFERNPVVYRCVRMIAESAATIPWLAYTEDGEDEGHPFLQLLRRPNPVESAASFLERLYCDLMLAGNAYVELAAIEDAPREMHILRPDRMSVVPGPNGWPSAYEYALGAQKISFPVDSAGGTPVLHLRLVHPLDDHYGFVPLAAAQTPLDVHNAAAQWNKALLENAARPSGALVYTSKSGAVLSEDQVARLRAELDETFAGARNAGRPMLLEGGLDWKALSLSPKDMDFIAAKSDAAREIALAFGVPPLLLGLPGDNTFSNYAEANRAFWRQCVIPLVRRTQQGFSAWLAPHYGDLRLEADLDRVDALAGEREAEWRRIGAASFLSDDEKREALGWRAGTKRTMRVVGAKDA